MIIKAIVVVIISFTLILSTSISLKSQEQAYIPKQGDLVRLKGDTKIYIIQEGRKCFIPDQETFQAKGYQWDQIIEVDQATFDSILTGIPIPSVKPSFQYGPPQKACTDKVQLISDVTIPPNTIIRPGQSFAKTWRLRNTGTCRWENGYTLVFVGGSQMYAQDSIIVPPIQPKGVVDISVPMIAPSTPGTYQSQWRMRNERGELFGTPVWVKIVVKWR